MYIKLRKMKALLTILAIGISLTVSGQIGGCVEAENYITGKTELAPVAPTYLCDVTALVTVEQGVSTVYVVKASVIANIVSNLDARRTTGTAARNTTLNDRHTARIAFRARVDSCMTATACDGCNTTVVENNCKRFIINN